MTERFVFFARVSEVFERKLKKHVKGVGENAIFETHSDGWYIQFGFTTVYVGKEEPKMRQGDRVKITIEKELSTNANP